MFDKNKINENISNRNLKDLVKSASVNHDDILMQLMQLKELVNVNIKDQDVLDEINFHLEMLHLYAVTVNSSIVNGILKHTKEK